MQKPLFFCICLGIGLHVGALFWLHNLPLGIHSYSFQNKVSFEENTYELMQRKERTALLTEIFENLSEAPLEIKEELHELKAEYAPTLEIAFAADEPLIPPPRGLYPLARYD